MLAAIRHRLARSALTQLLLVALVVRALVPAGFMPASHAGWPTLEYCGPAAAQLASAAEQSPLAPASPGLPDHSGTHHDACPFALSPAAAPVPELAAAFTLARISHAAPGFRSVPLPARIDLRAHRPRGPPQSA